MADFKSWRSFWEFEQAIASRTRYIRDADTEGFLETVRQTAEKRVCVLPPETALWRSQLGNDREPIVDEKGLRLGYSRCPFGRDRMKPPSDRAAEGRANPVAVHGMQGRNLLAAVILDWREAG